MRALVVDDDLINRKYLQVLLKDFGACDIAENGKDAVALVAKALDKDETYYDIIFLDIMMPEMNGHETLTAIRELEENKGLEVGNGSKVVMVTCLEDKKNILSSFREGCEYYLVKPLQPDKIYTLLSELGLKKD